MRDSVLWRKKSHIIMMLADRLEIDPLKNKFVDLTFNEWKHRYLDKIFFISNKMRDIYNEATQNKFVKKYEYRMEISYLGCTKMFDGLNTLKHSEKLRIVSCSYVRPEKRIDLIMEAIAYGIPVAATDVGGVSEIIEKEHGLLIGADDNATTIVNKLEDFFCSYKANPQAMRTAAFNFWKGKFNAETNYKKFLEKL